MVFSFYVSYSFCIFPFSPVFLQLEQLRSVFVVCLSSIFSSTSLAVILSISFGSSKNFNVHFYLEKV